METFSMVPLLRLQNTLGLQGTGNGDRGYEGTGRIYISIQIKQATLCGPFLVVARTGATERRVAATGAPHNCRAARWRATIGGVASNHR